MLKELDKYLSQFSYIGGYQPTQEDVKVFNFVGQKDPCGEIRKYLHLSRWLHHLSTFSTESRAALPSIASAANPSVQTSSSEILAFIDRCAINDASSVLTNPKAKKIEVSSMNRCGM